MVGEFKDDQIQEHYHHLEPYLVYPSSTVWVGRGIVASNSTTSSFDAISVRGIYGARHGDTTHGKQKGIKFIIKVL